MHQPQTAMSPHSHLSLRIGALVLLTCVTLWPRPRGEATADELARSAQANAARAETTAAKLVSAPHAKLVVAEADNTHLND